MLSQFLLKYMIYSGIILLAISFAFPESAMATLCLFLAQSSGLIINLFSSEILILGDILQWPDGRFALRVTEECSALEFCGLLTAAILAYPTTWSQRLKAILLGLLVIQSLNILRLVSLYFAGYWWPNQFTWIHENLWPLFLSIDLIFLFLLWVHYLHQQQRSRHVEQTPTATI